MADSPYIFLVLNVLKKYIPSCGKEHEAKPKRRSINRPWLFASPYGESQMSPAQNNILVHRFRSISGGTLVNLKSDFYMSPLQQT